MEIRGLTKFRDVYYFRSPQVDGHRLKRTSLCTKDLQVCLRFLSKARLCPQVWLLERKPGTRQRGGHSASVALGDGESTVADQ